MNDTTARSSMVRARDPRPDHPTASGLRASLGFEDTGSSSFTFQAVHAE